MPCSAVILAGGRSRRMGPDADKALLTLEGHTLLARAVRALAPLTDDIQVVGRTTLPADCPPVRLTRDIVTGAGPLAGLHAGLVNARWDAVVCTACDYPFLSTAMVELLLARSVGHDAVVPTVDSVPHVTQAVYGRALVPRVERLLHEGRYRLREVLDGLDVTYVEESELRVVDPDLRGLLNVNGPEEWEQAQALAREP